MKKEMEKIVNKEINKIIINDTIKAFVIAFVLFLIVGYLSYENVSFWIGTPIILISLFIAFRL